MNDIGKPERETQRRVLALFRDGLRYRFLSDWTDRYMSSTALRTSSSVGLSLCRSA